MKKIIILLVLLIVIFSIYLCTNNRKALVFSIGLDDGNITYNPEDYRVTDIIIDIGNNINIEGYDIQNLLVRSTCIKINLNEYFYLKNYQSIISQISDLENLFKIIRKYTKEDIYISLLDEENILGEYANKKIILLSEKYDIMILR